MVIIRSVGDGSVHGDYCISWDSESSSAQAEKGNHNKSEWKQDHFE